MQDDVIQGYRLSPQQERLWVLQSREESFPYRLQGAVEITGDLDVRALKAALDWVIERHEILRTTYRQLPGMALPLQVINDDATLELPRHDLGALSLPEQEQRIRSLLAVLSERPQNLAEGPIFHAELLELGTERFKLLIDLPALCGDRTTLENLVAELGRCYAATVRGEELTTEATQYADYSDWQQELLESEDTWEGRYYWRRLELPVMGQNGLPFERPHPNSRAFASAWRPVGIDRELANEIEARVQGFGGSVEAALLGVWGLVLSRVSENQDLVVAVACAGRKIEQLKDALGPYSRNLPMACRLSPEMTFEDLVQRVHDNMREVHAWQECFSWSLIAEQAKVATTLPFGFEFHRRRLPAVIAGELRFCCDWERVLDERFLVKLSGLETKNGLELELLHDANAVRQEDATRLGECLLALLEDALGHPNRAIGDLNLLGRSERLELLTELNRTARPHPASRTLFQLFEEQASRSPERVAVLSGRRHSTYAELDAWSHRVARDLQELGVGPEVRVALWMERSLELLVGLLGILKAGGAYVPIDPAYPRERQRYMLEDCRARVLLTRRSELESNPAADLHSSLVPVLCLDRDLERHAGIEPSGRVTRGRATPSNLSYVIYTSGSTGRPKGVMVTHRAITNRLLWMQQDYPLTSRDVLLQKTPFSFDASIWELFVPLLAGARLVLADPGGHRDPAYLVDSVERHRVTVLQLVPSFLQAFFDQAKGRQSPRGLRWLFCGGEALPGDLATRARDDLGCEVFNLYGPTEAAIDATCRACGERRWEGIVPIGRPLANVQIYLLDRRFQPVLKGLPGELSIGGAGLARGYLNHPGLSARSFVPHSWGAKPGERLYRTGDLARYAADGDIEFLGRVDTQVKVRGFRIELGEIEVSLLRHPAVREAAVALREDASGEHRLIAYVAPEAPAAKVEEQELYKLPNGLDVLCLNRNETNVIYREVFEDESYLRHDIVLPEDACIFDVGANIGLFTLFMKQRCPESRLYAFEPIPPTFEILEANVSLYGLDVELFACGLAERPGSARFTFYPAWSSMSGIYADERQEMETSRRILRNQDRLLEDNADDLLAGRFRQEIFDCPLMTLSQVIREHGIERIDLLKIDVEKSEHDVLAGLAEKDWDKVQQLIVEVHDIDDRLERIRGLLTAHGFELTLDQDALYAGTGIYNVYALRPSRSGEAARQLEPPAPLEQRTRLSVSDLRRRLVECLPDHMVPADFLILKEFPRLPNGKVDRQALAARADERGDRVEAVVAPRTATEEVLAAIWANLLQVEQVGIGNDFFQLGGHSLIATQVIARIRGIFHVRLRVADLFEGPTIAALAARVDAARKAADGLEAPPIVAVGRDSRLPLSFAQLRLWFLQLLEPESAAYNLPIALRLIGSMEVQALEYGLNEIVRRHESLRTTFEDVDGDPVQVIHPASRRTLPVVDLTGLPKGRDGGVAKHLVQQASQRPFDLDRGPLLRIFVVRLTPSEQVLFFNLHHIVSDGWSNGLLVQEMCELYTSFLEERSATLPRLPIQYADFAHWQRQWLREEVLERHVFYWRERLAGAPEVLPLPIDRPRPGAQSYRGAAYVRILGGEFAEAIRRLSRNASATLYMTLLTTFKVLLKSYGAGDDIVVGTNVANRGWPEVENLVGFFVDALVLRTDLSGAGSFTELLGRVRETVLGAFAHQDLPFDRLVDELNPRRDLSVSPVFQVVFDMNPARPPTNLSLPGLVAKPLNLADLTAKFDLTLTAVDTPGGIGLGMEYATDVLDRTSIARMLGHFERLLAGVVRDPDLSVARISFLAPGERFQILSEFQGARRTYPEVQHTIHELFENQAALVEDRIAALFSEVQLTYGELDRRSNQLALLLRQLGVHTGCFVGIFAERDVWFLTAILAILKAGGAYVPFEPTYPADRLRYMIADSEISTLITSRDLVERLEVFRDSCLRLRNVVCLGPSAGEPAASGDGKELDFYGANDFESLPEDNPEVAAGGPGAPAYMLYTSGSTGRPKGAIVRHDGAVNHMVAQFECLGIGSELCFLQSAPSSSDISVWQFLAPVVIGGRTAIVDLENASDPTKLLRALQTQRVTLVELVPAVWKGFLDHVAALSPRERALPALRQMMAVGEAVPVDLLNTWLKLYPKIPAVDAYGPTEASDDVTQLILTEPLPQGLSSVPIGRPLPNYDCYLLDRYLQPVPVGGLGEICTAGVGVGIGYLKKPRKTSVCFVPRPFAHEPGEVLYRTGDLGRWLPDGRIEFLGRIDHQVKIRGFRIEPGEVEAAIRQHPRVEASFVHVWEDNGDRRLVAYLVTGNAEPPPGAELRAFLKKSLPGHMIPAAFVILPALPLTPAGKVDRGALPPPDQAAQLPAGEVVPPRTRVEETMVKIWKEVLRLEQISIESDFFELGGHSLLATQILSRVRSRFEVDVPLRMVFEHATIAEFATVVERAKSELSVAPRQMIQRVPRQVRRVTHTREGMLKDLARADAERQFETVIHRAHQHDPTNTIGALNHDRTKRNDPEVGSG